MAELQKDSAALVLFSGSPRVRNHDCDYRFRPDSDFWYLTGFAEPESVLVMLPPLASDASGSESVRGSVLFVRERDRDLEIWNGLRLGVEDAPETLGVDHSFDVEDLWSELPKLLKGFGRVVYHSGLDEERDRLMTRCIDSLRKMARSGVSAPTELVDVAPYVHEMRLFKTDAEIEFMRKAAEITTEAHMAAMRETEPGMKENEIDALIEYTFKRRGSTGPAYTNIVAGGSNACILHYVENDQPLESGDLLLIDAGAEWDYYASDVTRTFPVNGKFSDEQRAIYEVVLKSQVAAIEHIKPGVTFLSIHEVALKEICKGLLEIGLLDGTVESIIEEGTYKRFFMHKTGHWLGLDVHDQGVYGASDGSSRVLEPGMVTTVEPGIYVAADDETVEARWRGIGVRIEDDIVVTKDGYLNLTEKIVKTVEDVEAVCQGKTLAEAS